MDFDREATRQSPDSHFAKHRRPEDHPLPMSLRLVSGDEDEARDPSPLIPNHGGGCEYPPPSWGQRPPEEGGEVEEGRPAARGPSLKARPLTLARLEAPSGI